MWETTGADTRSARMADGAPSPTMDGSHRKEPSMPIFPEHLHVAGEDAQLHDLEFHERTRRFVDIYLVLLVIAAVIVAVAILLIFAL
jgi:hypothetical protein